MMHSVVSSQLMADYAIALLHGTSVNKPQSGTEHTCQHGLSSTAFCQCHRVTQTTTLVANPPSNLHIWSISGHQRHSTMFKELPQDSLQLLCIWHC